ncbi:MAG TPA: SH3 domain-containing protein [Candidatus Dojkabacteria bacterium]|nr:SH3 domain-containing protein [Candidatus Dojkabacteria bacterium]
MKNIKKTIKSALLAVTLLLLSSVVAHAGFGISPADFNVDFLKPGSTYTKTYLLSRSGDFGEMNIVVEPDMGIANDWLSFTPGKSFIFKKGARTMEFKVTVNVPISAEYKEYPGTFTLRALPSDAEVRGVTIAQGLELNSDIKVTEEEIKSLAIQNIRVEDTVIGTPIVVKLVGDNKGNVDTTPTLKIVIMDLQDKVLEEHDIADLATIEAGVTKEVSAEFGTSLEKGEYYAEVEVFLDGKALRKEKMVFNMVEEKVVTKAGTEDTDKSSITTFLEDNKDYLWIVALAALIGLLVLVLISVFWKGRDREGKSTDDPLSVAGGSKSSTRVTLSLAFGLLATLAIITNISSNIEVKEAIMPDRQAEVQGTTDTIIKPSQPMLTVVESVVRNKEGYPVYDRADETSNVIYEAKENEQLEVVRESGDWYQVKLPTGAMGWVSKSIVKSETTRER